MSGHGLPASCDGAGPTNLRKRHRTACTRCKNRKQKCDDELPTCSNCLRAGVECDKTDVANDTPPLAYTKALEEHVALLERLLDEKGIDRGEKRRWLENRKQQSYDKLVGRTIATEREPNWKESKDANALEELVGIISVGNFEAPAYLGPSAGLSLAANLGEMVQATVWKKAIPEVTDDVSTSTVETMPRDIARPPSSTSSKQQTCGSHVPGVRAVTLQELLLHSVKEPPADGIGSRLLDAYFQQLHPRYPFLDPVDIRKLHDQRIVPTATAPENLTMAQRFGIFKLYMVYAIGATLLQLMEKNSQTSPECLYMTALLHTAAAKEPRTIQSIEAMTLLVIYHLRSASGHGLWYMIGLAMRTCIDLGLHRKGYEQGLPNAEIQYRRRLFWSVYSLERTIAISLGRPVSISDRQLDVDLPAAVLEGLSPSPSSSWPATTENYPPDSQERRSDNIEVAIFLFKLRRIESRIHHSVYRTDKTLAMLRPKLDGFYEALETWRISLLDTLPPSRHLLDYPLLHYYRAVRLLIQPFLTLLPASDPYYTLCLRAAGNICQTHKRLHQALEYGHSFIAVQTVFVAGVTLLYGLWTQGHRIWSVTLADDIRTCSLVLFVMSERSPWVRKYRDAFEVLVNAVMQKLGNVDSRLMEIAAAAQAQQSRTYRPWSPGGQQEPRPEKRRRRSVDPGDGSDPAETTPYWASGGPGFGELGVEPNNGQDGDVWRVVMELATWMDQDKTTTPMWMPNFEDLQNLST